MKYLIFGVLLISIIALAGCSQTVVKYQCADGSFVDSANSCSSVNCKTDCPQLDCASCPAKIEYQEKIVEKPVQVLKYQCADETIKDKLSDCPVIPESQKISKLKSFSGDSDTVTEQFYLKSGLTIFKLNYEGDSNFQVYLIDGDGDKSIFVNEVGEYSATKSETISNAGYYRLEVDIGSSFTGSGFSSKADWSIDVEQ
ncbi:MAG: hypothetical protein ABH824_03500 [Nanoarchaeota archaeon]|nr:hypothetical protein [Nanoarchaeota archaeon]MBU1632852.1 hypothetical protein [Nanoarchaeota archaeon]MBU1876139.1 hypothetical protein [Nanoarchaeota archaeon]